MFLEIITPDKKVFNGEVSSATFPGVLGSVQILENHAPIVSTVSAGKIKYIVAGKEEFVDVLGGVVEVSKNKAIVLAE